MGKLIPKDILLHNEAVVRTWWGDPPPGSDAEVQLTDSGQRHWVEATRPASVALLL